MAEQEPKRGAARVVTLVVATITFIGTVMGILIAADQMGFIHILPGSRTAASGAERAAWQSVSAAPNKCEALRGFIREFPEGAFAAQAQTLLAARTERPAQRWVAFSEPSIVTGSSNMSAIASEAAACQSAQESARRNGEAGCDLYRTDTAHFRNITLVMPPEMQCDCRDHAIRLDAPGGANVQPIWRCTIRSSYQCNGEASEQATEEFCGD